MITFNEKFGRKKPSDLALTNVLTYSPKTEKQGFCVGMTLPSQVSSLI
jgi:hypothetical protein